MIDLEPWEARVFCSRLEAEGIDYVISAGMNGKKMAAGSTGQCNTACSLSAGVSKPKVFRGR
jgi:hypothetical protein